MNSIPPHQQAVQYSYKASGRLDKREMILDAATQVFLSKGYAAASMDEITRIAGVSKRTVYSHFGSKEGLFGAIVRTKCKALLAPLLTPKTRTENPATALPAIARSFLNGVMAPTSIALYRLVVAEAARFPALGYISYENGPAIAINNLAAYLEEQTRLGRLDIRDFDFAAEQFFSLLLGYVHIRVLWGIEPCPEPAHMARHIEANVRTFLDAYGSDKIEDGQ